MENVNAKMVSTYLHQNVNNARSDVYNVTIRTRIYVVQLVFLNSMMVLVNANLQIVRILDALYVRLIEKHV